MHTTQNNQHEQLPLPYAAALLSLHGKGSGTPNHHAVAPYGFVAGVQRFVCARDGWFFCLG
jgi:hypothetical protein